MSMFFNLMAAAKKKDDAFTIGILISENELRYGLTPRWNAGGYCNVDWGDGTVQAATTSGTALTHTYAAPGEYTIRIRGDLYRLSAATTNPGALRKCNGNWSALGTLTSGDIMFYNAANAVLDFTALPPSITSAQSMFNGCTVAPLRLSSLPAGLTGAGNMFQNCFAAELNITSLPAGITNGSYMFYRCFKATIDLDTLVADNPGNWPSLTNVASMFYQAGSGNSPGTVTGSQTAFKNKCPDVSSWSGVFFGTNTTT